MLQTGNKAGLPAKLPKRFGCYTPQGKGACERVKGQFGFAAIDLANVPDLLQKLRDSQDLEERSFLSLTIAFLVYKELLQTNNTWHQHFPGYSISIRICQNHRLSLTDILHSQMRAIAKGGDTAPLTQYIAQSGNLVVPTTFVHKQCIEYAMRYFYKFSEITQKDIDDANRAFILSEQISNPRKDSIPLLRQDYKNRLEDVTQKGEEACRDVQSHLGLKTIDSSNLLALQQFYESLSNNRALEAQCALAICFLTFKELVQTHDAWNNRFCRSPTSFELLYSAHRYFLIEYLDGALPLLSDPNINLRSVVSGISLVPETLMQQKHHAMRYFYNFFDLSDEERIDIDLLYLATGNQES